MAMPYGVFTFGAPGAGELAEELSKALDFAWIDQSSVSGDSILENKKKLEAASRGKLGFAMSGEGLGNSAWLMPFVSLAVRLSSPGSTNGCEKLLGGSEKPLGGSEKPLGDCIWQEKLRCPIWSVDSKEDFKRAAKAIASRFYVAPGEPYRVVSRPLWKLAVYRFTVIFTRFEGKWIYCRKKGSKAFETAGGHIEGHETPLECAKRELWEETGISDAEIKAMFDYSVHTPEDFAYGQVFLANAKSLGKIPEWSEMEEIGMFDDLPDCLSYPQITPTLLAELKRQTSSQGEYWDLYDMKRNPLNRLHRRGDPFQPGECHIVVRAWIMNSKGEFLITRRSWSKLGWPGAWEVPGGSALAGETAEAAVAREAKEECGIALSLRNGTLVDSNLINHTFFDAYLFRYEFDLADIVLQEGETMDAKAVTYEGIEEMMERGEFVDKKYCVEFEFLGKIAKRLLTW
jgi:8-oxo-dGTP pyrophosphatase MutT (NUDIX family)